MNFQFYLEKLFASDSFNKFIKENEDAFPCSGFFILDKEGHDNKQHFDYFVPSTGKIFSFALEDGCVIVPMDIPDKSVPEEIAMNYAFDFNDVEKIISNEMTIKQIKSKIQKILLSLQAKDGKDFLVGTVFLSMFGLLKVNIDISEMKITDFEKKSFMDMLRVTKKD
jgi:hypothetical protein